MTTKTVFCANVFNLKQLGSIYEELFKWSDIQDRTGWKHHGFYLTVAGKGTFDFNFFITNESGLSAKQKDEIVDIFKRLDLTVISVLTDPRPASK